MNITLILVVVCIIALLSSSWIVYATRSGDDDAVPSATETTLPSSAPTEAPRTPPPESSTPTPTPTSTPSPANTDVITLLYPQIALPPAPPPAPTFLIVPGSNFPGITGLKLDAATQNIATSFPRLVVRAVPYGSPIAYEVRRDRVTVLFDPFTQRVISARVG